MKVGDLVRFKSKTLTGPNPIVLVVKVWPGIEGSVGVVNLDSGERTGRFVTDLEIVSASR